MTYTHCPNCGKALKGFLSASLVSQSKTDFINAQLGQSKEAYCTLCTFSLMPEIAKKLGSQKVELEKRLQEIIHHVPLMTSPAPVNWNYEVIGMITAQTTSGTGFVTELSRSFNDFFGSGSKASNQKVLNATNLCKDDLRIQAVKAGGNAVICTDIDFSEIGSGSTNMLMVCMAGTAIRVTDIAQLGENRNEALVEVVELTEKLEAIAQMPK